MKIKTMTAACAALVMSATGALNAHAVSAPGSAESATDNCLVSAHSDTAFFAGKAGVPQVTVELDCAKKTKVQKIAAVGKVCEHMSLIPQPFCYSARATMMLKEVTVAGQKTFTLDLEQDVLQPKFPATVAFKETTFVGSVSVDYSDGTVDNVRVLNKPSFPGSSVVDLDAGLGLR